MIAHFTWSDVVVVHVVLSLLGLAAGGAMLFGMLGACDLPRVSALFLLSTLLANVTGLLLLLAGARDTLGPGFGVGLVSLIAFVPTLAARYRFRLFGVWRLVHVAGAVMLLRLNASIAVRQAFSKIAYLQPLADTAVPHIAQFALLGVFILLGSLAAEQMGGRGSAREFHDQ